MIVLMYRIEIVRFGTTGHVCAWEKREGVHGNKIRIKLAGTMILKVLYFLWCLCVNNTLFFEKSVLCCSD